MNLLKNRPLCLGALVFLLVGVLSLAMDGLAKLLCVLFLLVLLLLFLIFGRRHRLAALSICIIAAIALLLSLLTFQVPETRLARYEGEEVTVCGRITRVIREGDRYASYQVKVSELDGKRISLSLRLDTYGASSYALGDTVKGAVTLTVYDPTSPGDTVYDLADGIKGCATATGEMEVTLHRQTLVTLAKRLNAYVRDLFCRWFDGDTAALLCAMLLGDRTLLDGATTLDFRRVGVSHLLALSGMHIAILCFAVKRLCRLLRLPRAATAASVIVFALTYSVFTGLSLSIVRAATMTVTLMLASLIRREYDSITSLFFAAALIVCLSPSALFDLGFWMSVTATFGVLLSTNLQRALSRRMHLRFTRLLAKYLLFPLIFTTLATLCTLPLTCFFFGSVSYLCLVANLLLPTLMTLLLYISLLSIVLPPLRPLTSLAGKGFLWLLHTLGRAPDPLLSLAEPLTRLVLLALVLAGCLFIFLPLKNKRPWYGVLGALCLALVLCVIGVRVTHLTQGEVEYVTEETGDFVYLHDGATSVLCVAHDGSYPYFRPASDRILQSGLDLDLLFLTHYQESMTQGVERLLSEMRVCSILLPTPSSVYETALLEKLEPLCEKSGTDICFFDAEHKYALSNMTLEILPRTAASEDGCGYFAFMAHLRDTRLTYYSYGYTDSVCYPVAKEAIPEESDTVIIGRHPKGAHTGASYFIPDEGVERILLSPEGGLYIEKELLPLLDEIELIRQPDIWSMPLARSKSK